ncbi:MAG: hypothetical protein IKD45_01580 [Clostridia bacterium]|nr:hypothetical protein [Clostridia bacterium]
MFGFFKSNKNAGKISEMLDKIEDIEHDMREKQLYAAIPYIDSVFDVIDDTRLQSGKHKLNDLQESAVNIYLKDIENHVSIFGLELIRYDCEQIIARLSSDVVYTGEEEQQKRLEHSYKICSTDIAEKEAMLDCADLSDIDRVRYEKELGELRAELDRILSEYTGKGGDNK